MWLLDLAKGFFVGMLVTEILIDLVLDKSQHYFDLIATKLSLLFQPNFKLIENLKLGNFPL